jgi:2-dehydropantoate 2-reductase
MTYLIIGAGGTGGSMAAFMHEAGLDVTIIARGAHLKALQTSGLRMQTTAKGNYTLFPIKACTMEDYNAHPDVIFVCVKGYSLDACVPFIERVAHKETLVIPILNIYGTGGRLQEKLPHLLVTDGCIYIAAEIKEPGCISIAGDIFRVVFGVRNANDYRETLKTVEDDLNKSGIRGILSSNIQRDALQKFSFVSPMAACGAYFDVNAEAMHKQGDERSMFQALIEEILLLAKAMHIDLAPDSVAKNVAILDALLPTASTSMQRDLKKGGASEMDGLIFEVVRLGKKYGLSLPNYEKVAKKFGFLEG